jgi:hypothetical protein
VQLRVVLVSLVLAVVAFGSVGPAGVVVAAAPPTTEAPVSTVPVSTLNDFIPAERDLSDCISAVQKPGCGSESRSDYHQWLVFIVLIGGMTFIGWRVVAGARRNRQPVVEEPKTPTPQTQS